MHTPSYSQKEIDHWLSLTPEQRVLEGEALWNEFLVKYRKQPWEPFGKSFESFDELRKWLKQKGNPVLW